VKVKDVKRKMLHKDFCFDLDILARKEGFGSTYKWSKWKSTKKKRGFDDWFKI